MKQLGALSLTKTPKKEAKLERVQVGNNIELNEENICDGEITQLGRLMTALPIDLKSSRMIYIGAFLGLAEEAIVMAACSENGLKTMEEFGLKTITVTNTRWRRTHWEQLTDCKI